MAKLKSTGAGTSLPLGTNSAKSLFFYEYRWAMMHGSVQLWQNIKCNLKYYILRIKFYAIRNTQYAILFYLVVEIMTNVYRC